MQYRNREASRRVFRIATKWNVDLASPTLVTLEPCNLLEATPEHALAVEGHRLAVERRHEGILHHELPALVAMGLGFENQISATCNFIGFEFEGLREGGPLAGLHVIGDGFDISECTNAFPCGSAFLDEGFVGFEFGFRDGNDHEIDVGHFVAPFRLPKNIGQYQVFSSIVGIKRNSALLT
jgi:hypothetical protein